MKMKKAQSTIEFVVLMVAVVLGIIAALPVFSNAISNYMNGVADTVQKAAGQAR